MSKLFSKPKALLSAVLVLCMVATMLPAGIFTSLAGASNSDSLSVWHGDTIEPFQNYYKKDEDGELILDENQKPIPRPGTDFTNHKEPIEIANAKQLAFLLFALEGTRGTRDQTTNLIPVTFTFNGDTYNYPLPATGIGLFGNMTVKLTTDIDMNNIEIKTTNEIGGYMAGTFDGQGHTVHNIKRVSTTTGAGFFRQVGYGGVKNLTVTGTVSGTQRVGGIAGNGVSAPTFDNCAFIGTITASNGTVGGILGRNTMYDNNPATLIQNCYTAGTVKSGSNDAAGLVGYTDAKTTINTANKFPGGLVKIINSYSTMTIVKNGGSAGYGGLTGRAKSTEAVEGYEDYDLGYDIRNSHFSGKVDMQYPITCAGETVTNVFYQKGSHTGTAAGALGATAYEASEIDAIVAALNSGVDALEAAGTTGLNRWMAGADYPIFVQEEPVLGTLTVGVELIDLQKWPTYFNQMTELDSITVAATLPEDAPNFTKLAISAVDGEGNAVEIIDGAVALKEGQTTVISVKTTYKELTKTYTVNIYRKPVAWDGTTEATAFAGGSGTSSADPYQIANGAQLALMAKQVNAGTNASAYFELIADIDISGHQWTPIGSSSKKFSGSFNGNDHTITGMTINAESSNQGLFGYINGATIEKLKITNATINAYAYIGGVAARSEGATKLSDCSFQGTIIADVQSGEDAATGGLIGCIPNGTTEITNCTVESGSSITVYQNNSTSYAPFGAGGLVGAATSGGNLTLTISNSSSAANVIGAESATDSSVKGRGFGGIVGYIRHSQDSGNIKLIMQNCHSSGTISAEMYVGGLIGFIRNPGQLEVDIDDCYSTATTSYGFIGGLYNQSGTYDKFTITIDDSHFAGSARQPIMGGAISANDIYANLAVNNVYYLKGSCTANDIKDSLNDSSIKISNVAEKTVEEFANGTVTDLLGTGWATSSKGYPIHSSFSVVDNALVKIGTSIRTFAPTGMRFYFKMRTDANKIAGLKQYGVVLAKAENAESGLFYNGDKTANAIAFDAEKGITKHVLEDKLGDDDHTYDHFTALLNIESESKFDTHYIARAYALYEDEDGQEIIVYSEVNNSVDGDGEGGNDPIHSTLTNVAQLAYADHESGKVDFYDSEVTYLKKILGIE